MACIERGFICQNVYLWDSSSIHYTAYSECCLSALHSSCNILIASSWIYEHNVVLSINMLVNAGFVSFSDFPAARRCHSCVRLHHGNVTARILELPFCNVCHVQLLRLKHCVRLPLPGSFSLILSTIIPGGCVFLRCAIRPESSTPASSSRSPVI